MKVVCRLSVGWAQNLARSPRMYTGTGDYTCLIVQSYRNHLTLVSVQISSFQSLSRVRLCDPKNPSLAISNTER